jgi:23S rRNA pseudouridine1911/1915/1917 synthase
MPSFSCTVEDTIPPGLRLDRYAAEYLGILSRSQIKARALEARLNGRPVKISRLLRGGELLELSWKEAESLLLIPQDLPLDVLYEDSRVIVVNKAQGMVVHPGVGNPQGTLANALLYRMAKKNNRENQGGLRPGIVQKQEKDTSGVIIAAWDEEANAFLSEQFKLRKAKKSYAALVRGCPKDASGAIEKKILRSRRNRKLFAVSDKEGKPSLTRYRLVKSWGKYSLLLVRPKTGRTHQIRVHLKYLGCPILGDPLYGTSDSRFPASTLMLHAKRLSLVIPGHERPATFRTRLPSRFLEITRALNSPFV